MIPEGASFITPCQSKIVTKPIATFHNLPIVWSDIANFFLWSTLILYGIASLWWIIQVFVLSYGWQAQDTTEIGLENIQVRILTVDAEGIVQTTADAVPDAIAGTHIIAEREFDVADAAVHVVPDEFDSAAQRKGRAMEWARREIPCSVEYVLYLDEDSLISGLSGLPAADVVQLSEHPMKTGSRLSYICEIFRIGFQFEQRAFHRLDYPAYAWGGAIAVRHELEDQVTWNIPSITEDTIFLWRAARYKDLDYRLVTARIRNQAPATILSMIRQRRRWISGTIQGLHLLPHRYQPVMLTRILTWALSPIIPLLGIIAYVFSEGIIWYQIYITLSVVLYAMVFLYMIFGLVEYRKYPEIWWAYIFATPLAVLLHSLGALWGIVQPVIDFKITEKTTAVEAQDVEGSQEQ